MHERHKILMIDDEPWVLESTSALLRMRGYECTTTEYGIEGLYMAEKTNFDAIILDLCLLDIDGMEVLKKLVAMKKAPVIILSGRKESDYRTHSQEAGANYFVPKPFDPPEFVAIIRNQINKFSEHMEQQIPQSLFPAKKETVSKDELSNGEIFIDFKNFIFKKRGNKIELTREMFDILKILTRKVGNIASLKELNIRKWDNTNDPSLNLRVYIRLIRKKIEDDPTDPKIILTVHGIGYKFNIT